MSAAEELGIAYQITFWVGFGGQPRVLWCDSREQAGRVMASLAGHADRIEFVVVQRMRVAGAGGGGGTPPG